MAQEQKKPGGFANAKASKTTEAAKQSESSVPNAMDVLEKLEAAKVKVIHGANDGEFNLSGSKVQTVRASLVDAFNIPGDATAYVNGEQVDANYVLKANDTLEFVKQAGVKG